MRRRIVVRRHRPGEPLHHLGEVMLDGATLSGTEGCRTVSGGTNEMGVDQVLFKFCLVAVAGQLTLPR